MKKRLLSFMTLLLGITLGLQAQTTLYSWEGGADGATETGGKAESVNGTDNRLNYKNGDNYTMCLNGKKANINDATASANASKMVITLDSELAEGDEIAFTAYINKNDTKKASPYILFENGISAEGEIFSDAENIDPAFNGAPATKVTKVPAEAAGSKTITLSRSQSGTNLFITKLVITRAGAKPAITFEAGAVERTVTITLLAAGDKASIDWGDGNKVELAATEDAWGGVSDIEFTGTPAGTVKIYGENIKGFASFTKYATDATTITGGITSIDLTGVAATLTSLDVHQNNLTSIDLSKLTNLTDLNIGVNDFTTIDLSANTELTKIDASNAKNNGVLTAIDLSKNTKLTNIVLSGNKLTTLDLTNNTVAKTVTVLNNQLTSVTFGDNTATKHTIQLGGNKLTTIDLSKFADASGMYLRLRDNDLTGDAIKLPCAIKQLWVDYNAFTLAQLYALKALATQTFTYATADPNKEAQAPMQITAEGDKVDLSSQAKLGETATVFTWKKADGTALVEGTDYTVADGVFTFLNAAEDIYCEMTNAELNAFTAEKPYKTTAVSVTAGGSEEAKPAIAFEAGAVERTVTVGLNAAGKVIVDWGNGTKEEKEAAAAYDGWDNALEFTGTPAGTVKVYGEGITYFESFTKMVDGAVAGGITSIDLSGAAATLTELDIHQNNLASVDLSKLTKLEKLTIGVNDFTAIDLSANTELTTLDITNGKLTAIDLSKNTKLNKIVLSGNKLTTLDLTNNTLAKTITVLDNQLTSVTFGDNTATKHTFNFGGNKLTTIDLSKFADASGMYLRLRDNDLTGDAIKLPCAIKQLWVDYNAFTLAQLYALKALATQTFTYATADPNKEAQAPMQITAEGDKVDLSSQAKLGETATVFTWKKADGTALVEGTDYTVADGVFTFLNAAEDIYCEMTNAELNAFTAEKPYKTTAVSVVATGINDLKAEGGKAAIFNMAGQRVAAPVKGLNIIDGKIVLKRN